MSFTRCTFSGDLNLPVYTDNGTIYHNNVKYIFKDCTSTMDGMF